MTMTGHGVGPGIELITESASAREWFFPLAFGTAKEGQVIGAAEIGAILAARAKEGRFRYIWSAMAPVDRSETKLIFLMILCIEHTLPLGGQIQVAQRQSGWTVEAAAERTQLDSDLWGSLRRRKAHQPLDSGRVQCAALAMTLIASGRRLAVEQTDRRLTLCL